MKQSNHSYWYYDVISPYAYLHWQLLKQHGLNTALTPVPVLFAGLLKEYGHRGPAEIPTKRTFTYRYVTWFAQHHNIAFTLPAGHPFNPLPLLRLAIATQDQAQSLDQILDFVWRDGYIPQDETAMAQLAQRLGLTDWHSAIAQPAIKLQLINNTQQALTQGVFGVPTIIVNDQLFWGADSIGMYLDYLSQPQAFDSPAMQRANNLPIAKARSEVS